MPNTRCSLVPEECSVTFARENYCIYLWNGGTTLDLSLSASLLVSGGVDGKMYCNILYGIPKTFFHFIAHIYQTLLVSL